jgi:hypothetical protein
MAGRGARQSGRAQSETRDVDATLPCGIVPFESNGCYNPAGRGAAAGVRGAPGTAGGAERGCPGDAGGDACWRRRAMGPFWRGHVSLFPRPTFPSLAIISERSSPSRVRFAAPNDGAPLTAPGRSEERLPPRGKGSVQKGPRPMGRHRRQNGPFFNCHRHDAVIIYVTKR